MARALEMVVTVALATGLATAAPAQDTDLETEAPLLQDGVVEEDGFGVGDALRPGGGVGLDNLSGVSTPEMDELMEDVEGGTSVEDISEGVADGDGLVDMPEVDALDDDASDLGRTAIGEIGGGPGQVRTPEVGEVLDDLGRTDPLDPGVGGVGTDGVASPGDALDM